MPHKCRHRYSPSSSIPSDRTPPRIHRDARGGGWVGSFDNGQRQIKRSALDTFVTGVTLTAVGMRAATVADWVKGEDGYDSEDYRDEGSDVKRADKGQSFVSLMDHYAAGYVGKSWASVAAAIDARSQHAEAAVWEDAKVEVEETKERMVQQAQAPLLAEQDVVAPVPLMVAVTVETVEVGAEVLDDASDGGIGSDNDSEWCQVEADGSDESDGFLVVDNDMLQ